MVAGARTTENQNEDTQEKIKIMLFQHTWTTSKKMPQSVQRESERNPKILAAPSVLMIFKFIQNINSAIYIDDFIFTCSTNATWDVQYPQL